MLLLHVFRGMWFPAHLVIIYNNLCMHVCSWRKLQFNEWLKNVRRAVIRMKWLNENCFFKDKDDDYYELSWKEGMKMKLRWNIFGHAYRLREITNSLYIINIMHVFFFVFREREYGMKRNFTKEEEDGNYWLNIYLGCNLFWS